MEPARYLLTVTGRDHPGLAGKLFAALESASSRITDVGQITIRGHLVLCIEVEAVAGAGHDELTAAVDRSGITRDGTISVEITPSTERLAPKGRRILVTLVAPEIDARKLAEVFQAIAGCGGDVERIVRLADYPVQSYELLVRDSDHELLRATMGQIAVDQELDIAVQRAGLHRRAKRLVVMDVDSTLLQGEVIDMLAARCGHEDQVAAITERAMAGEIDFATSLRERVALLEGLPASALQEVASQLVLMPGARTLLRTLHHLGYQTGVVSGGFSQVIAPLVDELGIDFSAANELELVDGVLTGQLVGPIIDRAGKAAMLREFASRAGIPLNQAVAVGDGANDIDMLSAAGLGIAFNARPIVREAADTALSVPYLDAVLFLLGISREEIETADAERQAGAAEASTEA
jgi:phosphoserine phosphatase